MHLEGEEFNALKGSIKTLQICRPIVAVTLYHSKDGAWDIPLFLTNNLPDYNFHIRCHAYAGTGVVMYAIPKERNK